MLPTINPTTTQAWRILGNHFETMECVQIKELFQANPNRFEEFSIQEGDLLVDFSKNRITQRTLSLLLDLANEMQLPQAIDAMFDGAVINATEKRAATYSPQKS